MKKISSKILLFLFLSAILSNCGIDYNWNNVVNGNEVILINSENRLNFEVKENIENSYRVLSFDLAEQDIEIKNGVMATLWAIPSDPEFKNKPINPSQLTRSVMFNLIPADKKVQETLEYLATNKKGCWKHINIEAKTISKTKENDVPAKLDLNFVYLTNITGSW